MDRGRAAWAQDKPHTLGHHGNSFRRRWIDLAAVSAEEGLAVDRLGGVGLAAIVLGGGAPMVLVSYAGLLFAPAAHAASLPYLLRSWPLSCLASPSPLPSGSGSP